MAHGGGRRESEQRVAEAPGTDWLVVALSAAGLLVSGYLTWLKLAGRGAVFCVAGSGCDLVQASRYAVFLGVPTALWGAALYTAIGILRDRKSTRLNSSHITISYAVFCL